MDATATQLTDIKFNEAKRGYDPVEVDNFLEKLGDAVVKLQDKVREANRRAEEADRRLAEAQREASAAEKRALDAEAKVAAGGGSADEDELAETLKKTLLLAQRTADDTVKEATAEATRLRTEAEQKAARLVEDANRSAAKRLAAVEDEIKARQASETKELATQVQRLEDVRVRLVGDIEALEAHLADVRQRIRTGADLLTELLEDPARLTPPARPDLTAPPVETVVPGGSAGATTTPVVPRPVGAATATPAPAGATEGGAPPAGRSPGAAAPTASGAAEAKRPDPSPAAGSPERTAAPPAAGSAARPGAPASDGPAAPEEAPGTPPPGSEARAARPVGERPTGQAGAAVEAAATTPPDRGPDARPPSGLPGRGTRPTPSGPSSAEASARLFPAEPEEGRDAASPATAGPAEDPAEPDPAPDPAAADDDFLDELRRAADEDPLGPLDAEADAAMQAFFTTDDEDLPKRPRFGRRR